MELATLYRFANLFVLIPWCCLLFLPRWKGTRIIVYSYLFPLFFSLLYLMMFIFVSGGQEGGVDFSQFSTLTGLTKLFAKESAVMIGWLHYLAFDLLVGIWEVRDAQKKGIQHWLLIPCLFFTLMAGPIGFTMYYILRFVKTKEWIWD